MSHYYHSQNAQDHETLRKAEEQIKAAQTQAEKEAIKSSIDPRLSGRLGEILAPPKDTVYSVGSQNNVRADGTIETTAETDERVKSSHKTTEQIKQEQLLNEQLQRDVYSRGLIVKSAAKETGGVYLDHKKVGTAKYTTTYTTTQSPINSPAADPTQNYTPSGTISENKNPVVKTWDQKAIEGLKSFSFNSDYNKYDPLRLRGAVAGAISIPIGIAGAIANPTRTGKTIGYIVTNPRAATFSMGAEIKKDLQYSPTFVIGQAVGLYYGGKGIGSITKKITPKAKITSTQGQKIAVTQNNAGQKTLVQAKFKINVGKKTYNVDSVGQEFAINLNKNVQSTVGGFKFQAGKVKAIQTNKGIRVRGSDTVASVTNYKQVTILKEIAGKPSKVSYSYGQKITRSDLIIQDQGLNTYSSIAVGTTSKAKIVPFSKLRNVFKKSKIENTKFDALEVGRVKEVMKVDKVTYSQAALKEVRGKPAANVLKKYKTDYKTYPASKKGLEVFRETGGKTGTKVKQATMGGSVTETIGTLRTGAIKTAQALYKQQAKPLHYTTQIATTLTLSKPSLKQNIQTKQKSTTIQRDLTRTKPLTKSISITTTKSASALKSLQLSKVGLIQEQKQNLAQKQAVDLKQNLITRSVTSTAGIPSAIPSFSTPPPPVITLPFINLDRPYFNKKTKKSSSFNQNKAFTPTASALGLGLRGKTSKGAIKSGLGQRYIPIQKKKLRGFIL